MMSASVISSHSASSSRSPPVQTSPYLLSWFTRHSCCPAATGSAPSSGATRCTTVALTRPPGVVSVSSKMRRMRWPTATVVVPGAQAGRPCPLPRALRQPQIDCARRPLYSWIFSFSS